MVIEDSSTIIKAESSGNETSPIKFMYDKKGMIKIL